MRTNRFIKLLQKNILTLINSITLRDDKNKKKRLVILWLAVQKVELQYCNHLKCGGLMKYHSDIKHNVCKSCGLSLTRHELDTIWQKVRNENASDADESLKKKNRRKEWLEWYSSSKKEKEF